MGRADEIGYPSQAQRPLSSPPPAPHSPCPGAAVPPASITGMGRGAPLPWAEPQQWKSVLGMEKQGTTGPAWWELDAGSEKRDPWGSEPRASTLPEGQKHDLAQLTPHREEGPRLSRGDPSVLHLPRLPVPTWLTGEEPALLGGLQGPQQHLFNHSALATQPLAMPWLSSEAGLTWRAQCLPMLVAWDMLAAHQVLVALFPHLHWEWGTRGQIHKGQIKAARGC